MPQSHSAVQCTQIAPTLPQADYSSHRAELTTTPMLRNLDPMKTPLRNMSTVQYAQKACGTRLGLSASFQQRNSFILEFNSSTQIALF